MGCATSRNYRRTATKPQRTATNSLQPQNIARMNEVNAKVLAGNVSYGSSMANNNQDQNLHIWKATGTTPGSANTEFSIAYQLDHLPLTITGSDTDNGGVIYRSSTPWTFNPQTKSGIVYLKCTSVSAAYRVILG